MMTNLVQVLKRGKILGSLLALALLWGGGRAALGQAQPPPGGASKAQAKPAVKSTPATAKSSAGTSTVPAATKRTKTAKAQGAKGTRSKAAGAGPPIPTPKPAVLVAGRRDPFKIPVPIAGRPGETVMDSEEVKGPLPAGTRGLLVSQLRLEGIVRQDLSNTMIAVVANYTNRAYFLRENDAVYNGVVSKITPDSVFFKVNYLDSNGRVETREVVKRLGVGSGEGR